MVFFGLENHEQDKKIVEETNELVLDSGFVVPEINSFGQTCTYFFLFQFFCIDTFNFVLCALWVSRNPGSCQAHII